MKIDEAIQQFLAYIASVRHLSKLTVEHYGTELAEFKQHLDSMGVTDVESITALEVRDWQLKQMEEGKSPATIANQLAVLRSWFKFLRKKKIVSADIMAKVTSPKLGKRLPVFFLENECERLYSADIFPEGFEGERDKLMLRMLYETGMRRSELASLTEQSISFSDNSIKVRGKGGKDRIIPIENELVHTINDYLTLRKGIESSSESLWVSEKGKEVSAPAIYGIVRKYMTLISNADRISPHVFRHSFATHMLNEGADINAIKELLGHADLSATEIYTHVTRQHLKETYKHAHPRANQK